MGFVLSRTDWAALASVLRSLSVSVVVSVLAINLSAHIFLVLRWHIVSGWLRARAPFATTLKCYALGLFYNLFLPSSIGGDVARSYYLFQANGRPQLSGASSILDRWAGLLSLLLMGAVASGFVAPDSEIAFLKPWIVAALAAYVLGSVTLMSRASPWLKSFGRSRLRAVARGRLRPLSVALRSVSTSLRLVVRRPLKLPVAILLTFGYYAAISVTHAMLAADMGLPVPMAVLGIYVPLVAVLSMVPITVNGIGLRELVYVSLFASSGWETEASLALSWVMFASVLLAGVPGFILQMLPSRVGPTGSRTGPAIG